ncbi:MAG: hypothetical protein QM785_12565 [Pyrinomonadaceae bacterium]
MSRERKEILKELINFDRSISSLTDELSAFPWDCEDSLVIVGSEHVVRILDRLTETVITSRDVENWADAIECRDGVDFESEFVRWIVFELANPLISDELTIDRAQKLRDELYSRRSHVE